MKAIILAAAIACLAPAAAYAQQPGPGTPRSNATAAPPSPGNVGVTQPTGNVSVPERGAVPAAQGSQSAAPGAKIDCVRYPAQCSEPVTTTGATGPSPGIPTQSK